MWSMTTLEEKAGGSSYHHGDLRRALVDAATQLVSCCGPAAVSLREVARIVGVSHNAPYRHFPTREALLAAVAARGFEMLSEGMRELPDEASDPSASLIECCRGYVQFAMHQRGIYQLMFSDEIQKSAYPELLSIAERAFESLQRRISALNPHLPAAAATITVWAQIHGIAHLILDNQLKRHIEDPEHDNLIEVATNVLVAGLINAPANLPDTKPPGPSG